MLARVGDEYGQEIFSKFQVRDWLLAILISICLSSESVNFVSTICNNICPRIEREHYFFGYCYKHRYCRQTTSSFCAKDSEFLYGDAKLTMRQRMTCLHVHYYHNVCQDC